jgi:hypothetical protein
MSNPTHTPGPWLAGGQGLAWTMAGKANAHLRAIYSLGQVTEVALVWLDNDRSEANARLIAAAPELLAAATQAQKILRAFCLESRFTQPQYIYEAIETLARATATARATETGGDARRPQ